MLGMLMPKSEFPPLLLDWYLGTAWSAGTISHTWLKSLCSPHCRTGVPLSVFPSQTSKARWAKVLILYALFCHSPAEARIISNQLLGCFPLSDTIFPPFYWASLKTQSPSWKELTTKANLGPSCMIMKR